MQTLLSTVVAVVLLQLLPHRVLNLCRGLYAMFPPFSESYLSSTRPFVSCMDHIKARPTAPCNIT